MVGLGQALAVFDILIGGTSAHAILRSSLLSIRDWYPLLVQDAFLDPITITPVFSDTVECLVKREIPVIRFTPPPDRGVVDRYTGLCGTLLPLLYDLCECSHVTKVGKYDEVILSEEYHYDPYAILSREFSTGSPFSHQTFSRNLRGWKH